MQSREYEKPFPYEELLKENITRQMEIDAELEIKDQEECVEVQEENPKSSMPESGPITKSRIEKGRSQYGI
ncbi:MAG: hypothetical protein ACLTZM_19125 [Ruminococcus sp.]